MANLDPTVARVLDRAAHDSNSDDDALIDALENDEDMSGLRERRLQQLHSEIARAKQLREDDHGSYQDIKDEKILMNVTTQTKLCVVHFYKSDFNRCRIMDGHLETLAARHFDTRFLRINVDNAPFLVAKLGVQVLPTVLAFIDGVSRDRLVGFQNIGPGTDSFTTQQLEVRLLESTVLTRAKMTNLTTAQQSREAKGERSGVEDDDFDEWE